MPLFMNESHGERCQREQKEQSILDPKLPHSSTPLMSAELTRYRGVTCIPKVASLIPGSSSLCVTLTAVALVDAAICV